MTPLFAQVSFDYRGMEAAWAIAGWVALALLGGWVALVAGWLKGRLQWRFLPRAKSSLWAAGICSVVTLTSMITLICLMLWRSQPFPFHSVAEGSMFVFYLLAPTGCLVLTLKLSGKSRHRCH
jgi:hypothetical protein